MLLDGLGGDLNSEVSHIAPRREINDLAPLRPNTIHCFGVDFLSNKEVLEIFSDFDPQNVEWLDDSSCNIHFLSDDIPPKVIQALADQELQVEPQQAWTATKPLTVGKDKSQHGKVKRAPLREFRLELRIASEADRKEPGHSGHTDSVFYAHVKEQQAIQKQNAELRSLKKRQRRSRFPSSDMIGLPTANLATAEPSIDINAHTQAASSNAPSTSLEGITLATTNGEAVDAPVTGTTIAIDAAAAAAANAAATVPRLGCGGLLDPLLYLRAQQPSGDSLVAPEVQQTNEDLRAALRNAETEYATVLRPGQSPLQLETGKGQACSKAGHSVGSWRRMPRGGHENKAQAREPREGMPPPRGKKRRPLEQEPRPVSNVEPSPRRPEALPEVEDFLKKHSVRCQRFNLPRTFRSIIFAKQKKHEEPTGADSKQPDTKDALPSKDLPPWEQYFQLNNQFVRNGQFMHTVAWETGGRQILTIVPHPTRVDIDAVARAVQKPKASMKQRKLKDIAKDTGFPVFVCPPFGHPKDSEGRDPVLLVDSTITEFKRPLLFDCGSVGLSVPVSEFFRSTGAACIEGLGKNPVLDTIMSAPEPAPEPAPAILQQPTVLCGGSDGTRAG